MSEAVRVDYGSVWGAAEVRWELDSKAVSGEDAHLVSRIPIVGVALRVLVRSEGSGRCSGSRCSGLA